MGEAFEVTFFCSNEEYDRDIMNVLSILYRTLDEFNSFGRKCKISFYSEEDKDYVEIELYIFDFLLKENTYIDIMKDIFGYVCAVFRQTNAIRFATGIYEVTYYYIGDIKSLDDFDAALFRKFPFVFFRTGHKCFLCEVLFGNEVAVCLYNKDAQGLF